MTVNGKDVIITPVCNNEAKFKKDINRHRRPYCLSDNIYRFIFIFKDGTFYIITPSVLLKYGYIGNKEGEGKTNLLFNDKNELWLHQFKNNLSWLKES